MCKLVDRDLLTYVLSVQSALAVTVFCGTTCRKRRRGKRREARLTWTLNAVSKILRGQRVKLWEANVTNQDNMESTHG